MHDLIPEMQIVDRVLEHGFDLPEVAYPNGFKPINIKHESKTYLIAVRNDRAIVRRCLCSFKDGRHALSCGFTSNSLSNMPASNMPHWSEE